MRVTILQSNYIPWKGYFDLMAMSDLFVVYDSVQFTKNDWRNRNTIMTSNGPVWLTIPVATAGRASQRIDETRVSDRRWARKHWLTIAQSLARRPAFDASRDRWAEWFSEAAEFEFLHDVNVLFLRRLADQLGIATPLVMDSQFELAPDTPTGRLVQLCEAAGADRYLTGPAGLNYLELRRFAERNIAVDVIDYSGYPSYPQTSAPFQHGVSAIDLIASVGEDAKSHLIGRCRTEVDHSG